MKVHELMGKGDDLLQPKFMTGIFGSYDPAKVARETRPGFYGVEISCLKNHKEADLAFAFARDRGMGIGVHFPLVRDFHPGVLIHAHLTSQDARARRIGFDAVARELDWVDRRGAQYLIVHYPKPAILKAGLDWSDWRIVEDGEAIDESATSFSEHEDLSYAAFETLAEMARGSRVKVIVEQDILSPIHYRSGDEPALLFRLLSRYANLGFCVDLGRLHLLEATDPEFPAMRFLQCALPYITNIHVWTVQPGTNKYGGHIPVHPDLRKEDGWSDMAGFLTTVSTLDSAYVMFEHRADLVTSKRLDETYAWVDSMLANESERA